MPSDVIDERIKVVAFEPREDAGDRVEVVFGPSPENSVCGSASGDEARSSLPCREPCTTMTLARRRALCVLVPWALRTEAAPCYHDRGILATGGRTGKAGLCQQRPVPAAREARERR